MFRKLAVLSAIVVAGMLASAGPAAAAWQPAGKPDSRFKCGDTKTVTVSGGYAKAQSCVVVHRNKVGAYYQGLVSAYYVSTSSRPRPAAFGAMAYSRGGRSNHTGTCPAATFQDGQQKWCFTATDFISHGFSLSASGQFGAGSSLSTLLYVRSVPS